MATPLERWVDECAQLTRPKNVVWADGSDAEYDRLMGEMLGAGTFLQPEHEGECGRYPHRGDPNDVTPSEIPAFVCTCDDDVVRSNNNWIGPEGQRDPDVIFCTPINGQKTWGFPYIPRRVGSHYREIGVRLPDHPSLAVLCSSNNELALGRNVDISDDR